MVADEESLRRLLSQKHYIYAIATRVRQVLLKTKPPVTFVSALNSSVNTHLFHIDIHSSRAGQPKEVSFSSVLIGTRLNENMCHIAEPLLHRCPEW